MHTRNLLSLSIYCFVVAGLAIFLSAILTGVTFSTQFVRYLVIFYALFILSMVWAIWRSFLAKRSVLAMLVVFGGQIYWFVIPSSAIAFDQNNWFGTSIYYTLNASDVALTVLALSFFALSFFVSNRVFNGLPKHSKDLPENYKPSRILMQVAPIAFSFVGILPFVVFGDDLESIFSGILAGRSAIKPWSQAAFESNPIRIIGRASLVTAGIISLLSLTRASSWWKRAWHLLIFLFSFLITYLDSGTRSWTAMILLPGAILYVHRRLASGNKWLFRSIVVGLLIILAVNLQVNFRNIGFSQIFSLEAAGNSLDSEFAAGGIGDNDFFTETAVALDLVPKKIPYVHESNLLLFLTNPIPRSIWPNKPYPRVVQLYGIGRTGRDEYTTIGVSRMPSIVGQYYMNWGIAGVMLVSLAYGFATSWLDREFDVRHGFFYRLFLATVVAWLFVSYRGIFPGFHYPVLLVGFLALIERRTLGRELLKPESHPYGARP